jgi:hypothetical protein
MTSFYVQWATLILLFIFAIYAMLVIKNEKKNYLKDPVIVHFKNFKFLIPKWWGVVETNSAEVLHYKRLDTRYEWQATFHWITIPFDGTIEDLFKSIVAEKNIFFDLDTSVIHNPSDFQHSPLIQSGLYEMVRVEGTATEDKSERLYYDAFIVREKKSGHYLFAESKSSVLNGLVEGPYFEEVMLRLEVIQ